MKAMQCEMCGSNDLIKTNDYYVCQHCNTKYAPDEAKKLFVEGVVKVDDSEEIANLYSLARRAVSEENYENAYKYYEQILVKKPNDWEANFYSLYCKSWKCTIAQIAYTASRLDDALPTNFSLIALIDDDDRKHKAVQEVCNNLLIINQTLFNAAKSNYEKMDYRIKDHFRQEYVDSCIDTIVLAYDIAELVESIFGEEYAKEFSVPAWKQGIEQHTFLMPNLAKKDIQTAEKMKRVKSVQKYEPDYYTTTNNSEGCYIATAIYGSYDCPQVWTLRRFRDYYLKRSCIGRLFIKVYYAVSPSLVRVFGHTKWFNSIFREKLDRIVEKLSQKGYDNNPYFDKG